MLLNDNEYLKIVEQIKGEIAKARYKATLSVNRELILLYYNIGKVINENKTWGNKFIDNLAKDIRLSYPDSTDEEAWLGLLEKDTAWLESLDASKLSCTFFDDLVEHFDRDDWVPDILKNVMDAYYEDLKELYSAFATVSGEHQGEKSNAGNPRKLNCVINDYLGTNYGDKDNIYAIMEILCHPKKYPHIENTIGIENLTYLDTAYEEFVRDGKSDLYPKDTKAEDIDLDDLSVRMRDKAWLEKMEKADITSEFFYSMAQLIAGMLDPSVPDNVQDAFDQDIKELYEAFDTVSDYRFPDACKLF